MAILGLGEKVVAAFDGDMALRGLAGLRRVWRPAEILSSEARMLESTVLTYAGSVWDRSTQEVVSLQGLSVGLLAALKMECRTGQDNSSRT